MTVNPITGHTQHFSQSSLAKQTLMQPSGSKVGGLDEMIDFEPLKVGNITLSNVARKGQKQLGKYSHYRSKIGDNKGLAQLIAASS